MRLILAFGVSDAGEAGADVSHVVEHGQSHLPCKAALCSRHRV